MSRPASRPNPLSFIVAVALLVYLSGSVVNTLYQSVQNQQRLKSMQQNVEQLRQQEKELEEKLKHVQSSRFIEEEARNKLGLAKPDETIVIFPEDSSVLGENRTAGTEKTTEEVQRSNSTTNFEQWYRLFWR